MARFMSFANAGVSRSERGVLMPVRNPVLSFSRLSWSPVNIGEKQDSLRRKIDQDDGARKTSLGGVAQRSGVHAGVEKAAGLGGAFVHRLGVFGLETAMMREEIVRGKEVAVGTNLMHEGGAGFAGTLDVGTGFLPLIYRQRRQNANDDQDRLNEKPW